MHLGHNISSKRPERAGLEQGKGTAMNTLRNLKYPIFIGAGLVAAGTMFYFVHSGVNSQHTQGAIGQRAVYRDTQVNASDVNANPGSAPVATKALMETK